MLAKSSYQGVLLGGKQYSEPLDCPPSIRPPTHRDTGTVLEYMIYAQWLPWDSNHANPMVSAIRGI